MRFTKGRAAMIAVMFAASCGGPWGCALKTRQLAQPPSDDVRAQLDTIGLPVARLAPETHLRAPTGGKGWGAAKGAGHGFVLGAMPGLKIASSVSGCGGGGGMVCGAVVLLGLGVAAAGGTVAALGGTVYGAVTADSAASVEAAQTELERVLAEIDLQSALRNHALRSAQGHGSIKFVAVEDHDPAVDTTLEVRVSTIGFADASGINPPVGLVMTASARLIRTIDGAELYAATFRHRSARSAKFLEWSAEGGQAFREEVDYGARRLADDIVQLLFPAPGNSPAAPNPALLTEEDPAS